MKPIKAIPFNLFLLSLLLSVSTVLLVNFSRDSGFIDLVGLWSNTHYAVNYMDFGFVKRGLIGTGYNLLSGPVGQTGLVLMFSVFIFVYLLVSYQFFKHYQLENKLIYLMFILSPATVMHVSEDFGRFDVVLVTCFILSILSIKKHLAWFALFSIIGVLTHEIYVFAFLPASFVLLAWDRSEDKSFTGLLRCISTHPATYLMLGVIALVLLNGRYEPGQEQMTRLFLERLPSIGTDPDASIHVWTRSVVDNLSFTLSRLSNPILILYTAVVLSILLFYLVKVGLQLTKPQYALILATSLPMFILGTDYGRWIAFIFISLFLTFIATETEKAREVSNPWFLIVSLYGPLGYAAFPSPLLAAIIIAIKGA